MNKQVKRWVQLIKRTVNMALAVILMILAFGNMAIAGGSGNTESGFPNLVTFTATYADGRAYLNWKVNTEQSNCLYIVERSTNGSDWEMVGSKEGFGNTHIQMVLLYSYIDTEAPAVVCNYRVRRIDQNGSMPEFITPVRKITPPGSQDLTRLTDMGD